MREMNRSSPYTHNTYKVNQMTILKQLKVIGAASLAGFLSLIAAAGLATAGLMSAPSSAEAFQFNSLNQYIGGTSCTTHYQGNYS